MPPSQRPFMGATPYADQSGTGVTFRVWAPFANGVAVAGEFNQWLVAADPLFSEGNGYWSVDLASARVGQQYKFVVSPASPPWRMDPYARSIIHDAQGNLNGLIAASDEAFIARDYSTPPWNEMVIYEMHVRTFLYGGGYGGTGSFSSAITKLDYLRDLGINAIEVMPLGEFLGDISGVITRLTSLRWKMNSAGPTGFATL